MSESNFDPSLPAPSVPPLVSVSKDGVLTLERLRALFRQNDAETCRQVAAQAGSERRQESVPALGALLKPPLGFAARRRMRQDGWIQARVAAARALGQIGDPDAIPVLAQALFDPASAVQESARHALQTFDDSAVAPLLLLLTRRSNWPLNGMRTLIHTLGALQKREAAPALARVLFHEYPLPPPRWANASFTYPLVGAMGLALAAWIFFCDAKPDWWFLSLIGCIVCAWLIFIAVEMLFFVPLGSLHQNRERAQLGREAAQALAAIGDKHALPSVIEVAFGPRRGDRDAARSALLTLLPLLKPEDIGLLQSLTLQRLTGALGAAASQPHIAFAILRALETVGTGQTADAVQRLAERGPLELRAEAARVLPILLERRRLEQASSSLLRASASPAPPAEQLLRPVLTDTAESAPEQLLRPGLAPD